MSVLNPYRQSIYLNVLELPIFVNQITLVTQSFKKNAPLKNSVN